MFVGVDQSLRSTGVALLNTDGHAEVIKRIHPPDKVRGAERLAYIRRSLQSVLASASVKLLAMEGYAYDTVAGRVFELGELGGMIKLLAFDMNIPLIVVAPVQLKKFVSGNAQASKDQMMQAVFKKWHQAIEQDDMADAYGLARVALAYEIGKSTCREELEVIMALKEKKLPFETASTRRKSSL